MEYYDPDFLPCSLALVIHTSPLEAQRILRFIHKDPRAKIVYKTVTPRGGKLWIQRGGDGP